MPEYKFRCPVEDDAPQLVAPNVPVAAIWQHAQRSASQVEAKEKTYIYCRPESILALLRIYRLPLYRWTRIMAQVALLDDIANAKRPRRRK